MGGMLQAGALSGIRVVDLTQFESGTSCTQALAWLGAEVIKVEEPKRGDQSRGASSNQPGHDSHYFLFLNANKKSVTCNLKSEEGRKVLAALIEKADVFVENYGPGVIERLGLSYEEVRKINPRIIYSQIKGYAPDGPFAKYLAFDMTAQAAGGALSVTGEPDGRPMKPGLTVGDTGTGLHCALGIVAALYQRKMTGEGQHIEVAMQEAVINFGRISFASQAMHDKPAPRPGNQSVLAANSPSEVYPCKGGGANDYCFIYTSRAGTAHWHRLLEVIGRADLIGDPRFETAQARYAIRDEVDAILSEWTKQYDKMTVMKRLGDAGVPAGAVLDTMELTNDPHLRKRGMFVEVEHPVRGKYVMPGWPVKMSKSEIPVDAAPLLGAHTSEIYADLLGMTQNDIDALKKSGAI